MTGGRIARKLAKSSGLAPAAREHEGHQADPAGAARGGNDPREPATRCTEIHMRGDHKRFPILAERCFFNHAAVAPIPAAARDAMRRYADLAARDPASRETYQAASAMKASAAAMLGADPDEIAAIPNTTTGLALVARGLDWSNGGSIVSTSIEFPANRYPWEDLARFNVGTRFVEPRADDGRLHLDDLVRAMREQFRPGQTNLLAVSHVQFATGQRLPIADLAAAAHEHGGLICVDAIQSVGAIPLDVSAAGIDFLSADGHKWMLGPEGAGIFYIRKDRIEQIHPLVAGWLCMTNPHDYCDYRFEFRPGAARYEPGCWNVAGMMGLGASLDVLLETGIVSVWARIHELTERLREGLRSLGAAPTPALDWQEQSGVVTFKTPDGWPLEPAAIVERLRERKIDIAAREGRLRVSPHFYNTSDQIDELLSALKDFLAV